MARMIPATIEIFIWMTNASPIPRTWTVRPSGAIRMPRMSVAK